jgi:hypothetical protein
MAEFEPRCLHRTEAAGGTLSENNGAAVQIGSASASCAGNTVSGNLEVQNNTGSTAMFNNTIEDNLHNQGNISAT